MEVKVGVLDFLKGEDYGWRVHSLFLEPLNDVGSVHVGDLMFLIQCL